MTKRTSEPSVSMSMNNGELGSVKRRSSGRDMDSAKATVACRVRKERVGETEREVVR